MFKHLKRILSTDCPVISTNVLQKTVVAVVPAIDHREGAVGVFIAEGEEVVAQQIHLEDRLFPAHGHHGEFLDFDELVFLGVFHIGDEGGGVLRAADEGVLADPAGQTGLVLDRKSVV